jgi:type VI secretion system secreted protein Hcp
MAAVDYFLKIEGVDKGESPDDKFKGSDGWIQIESWSFGESQGGTMQFGGGGGAGKVSMQDFHFTMKMNTASPKLFLGCATGEHYKKATAVARKAGTTQNVFLTVTFSDCLVSSYQTSGSGASDVIPMDSIALNFSKIEYEYKEQKADGSAGAPVKVGYDLKANKKV